MRIRDYKYILSFIMIIVLFCATPVLALELEESNHLLDTNLYYNSGEVIYPSVGSDCPGSIMIRLQDTVNHTSKNNVKLALTKVADVVNGEFVMIQKYTVSGLDLNAISNANETEAAVSELMTLVTPDQMYTTNEDGIVEIKEVQVGVYLLYEADAATYAEITPCLISVPMFDEQTNVMKYDIEVLPKYRPLDIEIERSEIFQTGIENYAMGYTGVSLLLFSIAAGMLFVSGSRKVL